MNNRIDDKAILVDALKEFTAHRLTTIAVENLADSILRSWWAIGLITREGGNQLQDDEKRDIVKRAFPALLGVE